MKLNKKSLILTSLLTLSISATSLAYNVNDINTNVYKVKAGDTLSELAVKFNVSLDDILKDNPSIKNKHLIYVNDELIINSNENNNINVETNNSTNTEIKFKYNISQSEFDLLTRLVHAEAKGESLEGKIAVVNVIFNRLESDLFPDDITSIIYQKNQFSPVKNGSIFNKPSQESIQAVNEALAGKNLVKDAVYFYAPSLLNKSWLDTRETVCVIGNHVFKK